MKRLIVAAIALLWSGGAWAACGVSTVQVKDNAAVTSNWTAVNDGTNCAGETALVAGGAIVAAANALPVQPGTGATWAVTQSTSPWVVSGTVTANAGTNLNTSLLALESGGNLATLAGGVSSSIYQENVKQINGVTPLMGNGVTGTGSPRATISSDNTAIGNWGQVATGAAPPASAVYMGANASGATGGHVAGLIQCDNHVFKHITSATDTLAVQGVASQTIYICGWRSRAAGVATWFLENTASANANCSSANTQITGVATEAANTGETWGGAFWSGLKNTSGNGLCINSTGTGGVDIDIWYTIF